MTDMEDHGRLEAVHQRHDRRMPRPRRARRSAHPSRWGILPDRGKWWNRRPVSIQRVALRLLATENIANAVP